MGAGEVVGREFEEVGGIGEAVDFVEDEAVPGVALEEGFGVVGITAERGDLAVDVGGFWDGFCKRGLADAAGGCEPDNGALEPAGFDAGEPARTGDHAGLLAFSKTKRK